MYFPVGTTQEFPRDEVTYLLSELARLKDDGPWHKKCFEATVESGKWNQFLFFIVM